jgi:hypothetical protein
VGEVLGLITEYMRAAGTVVDVCSGEPCTTPE